MLTPFMTQTHLEKQRKNFCYHPGCLSSLEVVVNAFNGLFFVDSKPAHAVYMEKHDMRGIVVKH
jgi:hypothetical protein